MPGISSERQAVTIRTNFAFGIGSTSLIRGESESRSRKRRKRYYRDPEEDAHVMMRERFG